MEYNGGVPVISYLLQQTLRHLCTDTDWIYAVFWRILPRNYPPPKWDSESSFFDRSKGNKRNWILVWEDGFCDFVICSKSIEFNEENSSRTRDTGYSEDRLTAKDMNYMQPELFFKMSHEVYNFGEGLIGKVAADNSHKWVYKEPLPGDAHEYPSSWNQGGLDPKPKTWEAQFQGGVQTIALISVKEGVIQLGSLKKTYEDLSFVLFLQRKFNYLQSIPGVFAVHPALTQHVPMLRSPGALGVPKYSAYNKADSLHERSRSLRNLMESTMQTNIQVDRLRNFELHYSNQAVYFPSKQFNGSIEENGALNSAHYIDQYKCLSDQPGEANSNTSSRFISSWLPSAECYRS
ncbi:hypothetical protein KP509_03G029800 [Ceratopteris richardii]|uniref:Transcription factor MYC/MYB N-terminal domain-containing protein n=1 Tax=Ceratopteris richardii TaxID=49495 RepID=A0A8T2UYB4_CERRI|nr:hypothetical protein KP509_03G029800 [Ceratopteris richardii]